MSLLDTALEDTLCIHCSRVVPGLYDLFPSHISYKASKPGFSFLCLFYVIMYFSCLQCFDTVGWVAGRAYGLLKLSGGMLAWLCVWVKVQICV